MRALLNSFLGMTLAGSLASFVIISCYYTFRYQNAKWNWLRIIALSLFTGYMTGLFSLTLEIAFVLENGMQFNPADVNLVLFNEISRFLPYLFAPLGIINLWGNILIFVPVGFAVPLLTRGKHPLLRGLLWSALISVFIECFQLFTPRTTDVDDVILNTLGGLIGAFLFVVFGKIFPRLAGRFKPPVVRRSA